MEEKKNYKHMRGYITKGLRFPTEDEISQGKKKGKVYALPDSFRFKIVV